MWNRVLIRGLLLLILLPGCRIVVRPDYHLDKLEYVHRDQSEHFVIYLEKTYDADFREDLRVWLEQIYEDVGRLLDYHPPERTVVKIYSTPLPATSELEFYGYAGDGAIYSKKYAETRKNLAHEYTHYVAARISGGRLPPYFNEGLATYVSNHLDGTDSPTFEEEIFRCTHGDFLHRHSLFGVRSIRDLPRQESAIQQVYAYRSSFISYIVEEFGFDVVLRALRGAGEVGGVEAVLERETGLTFDELDRRWEGFIRSHADPRRYKRFGLIRDWHVVGPFDNSDGRGFYREFPPETDPDPESSYLAMGREVSWRRYRSNHPVGFVNLEHCEFAPSDQVVAYALARVRSPVEQEVQIRAGASDTLTVWVNGHQVISRGGRRHFRPETEVATVRLRKGTNTILLKVCQFSFEWMFALRITDEDGVPIPDLEIGASAEEPVDSGH